MAAGLERASRTLFVVGTPIGNLEDITLRALRVLRDVSIIAAEDTRHTRILLKHHNISTPVMSYRDQNMEVATPVLIERLTSSSVALVADAGMPVISDPGAHLIARVIEAKIRIEVVPGPSAFLTALVGSGLPAASFTFVGFLSRRRGDRLRQLRTLAGRPETLVFYEAPHRVQRTLADLLEVFGDRHAAVCRELTKVHEETLRGQLIDLASQFAERQPRGEFTLVVRGAPALVTDQAAVDREIDAWLREALAAGADMRITIDEIAAATSVSRRTIYARWHALRENHRPPRRSDASAAYGIM